MQFLSGIFATALLVFTGVARGASLYQRGDIDLISRENIELECYDGTHAMVSEYGSAWIVPLAVACYEYVAENNTQMWSSEICVAAASVSGVTVLRDFCVCISKSYPSIVIPSQTDLESLSYDVYANVVGDCAWQPGGCPITQQNFIDMVYGSITAYGGTNWPTSAQEVIDQWNIIVAWAGTYPAVPYLNFNDWLHYSI
ncbi:hypothetical protein FISHEDRAFT_74723 [Fistulina hepatica ATCC 64428]|uniref:Uncharacterized protein n=1 Tax=Fistulina hepatica ATCC 64428 TaxID=1128425 RepID=A0A0D7AAJ7_9AGAR|nr:hypothetical protein FISHEDRAFT_74723 [Fistulina hepatica ATCC 64428]